MAFHVDDNFRAGAPISQVPASWFNAVASFLNNLVNGFGIKLTKNGGGQPSVIEIDQDVLLPVSRKKGTPVAMGTFPTNEPGITQDDSNLWEIGTENGAEVEILYKGEYDSDAGVHKVYAAKMTFSADGLLLSIDKITNAGLYIGA